MVSKSLALGFISLSVLATVTLATKNANADEPFCYMRTTDGRTINLTNICAQKLRVVLPSNDNPTTYSSRDSVDPDQALDAALRQLNDQDSLYGKPAASPNSPSTQVISQ